MDEKPLPRPARFNAVGFCLTAIRMWQWSSSFFVYASFSLLYSHIRRNRLGENDRMRTVQVLGLVSVIYSTLTICCVHIFKTLNQPSWRFFAILSLPGDLAIMGIGLAKITVLSFSGLPADCHGLTRQNYDGTDLVRQPADGYNTIRFGSWDVASTGELDRLCTFPRTVYGLSVVAIFSYTFSILLSVLYIQQQKPEAADSEKAYPQPISSDSTSILGYAEEEIAPDTHAPSIIDQDDVASRTTFMSGDSSPLRSPSPPATNSSRGGESYSPSTPTFWSESSTTRNSRASSTAGSRGHQSVSTWSDTTFASDMDVAISDTESVVSGASLPPQPLPSSSIPPQRRWSTSTNSSYNANAFIVTDGFRPGGDPPAYSSRPGSLYQESMKYEAGLALGGSPMP